MWCLCSAECWYVLHLHKHVLNTYTADSQRKQTSKHELGIRKTELRNTCHEMEFHWSSVMSGKLQSVVCSHLAIGGYQLILIDVFTGRQML